MATAAKDAGAASSATEFTATVYLAGQNPAGLAAYAKAVSDPSGASYGKYLSPAAYKAQFGATKAQVRAVTGWLTGAGLTVVSTDEHAVTVKGTNAALNKAFGTSVHQYKVSGALRHAPAKDVTVPADVASAVLGVAGLTSLGANVVTPDHTTVPQTAPQSGKGNDGLPAGETCSEYYGQKTAPPRRSGYSTSRAVRPVLARTPRSCARPTASPPPA